MSDANKNRPVWTDAERRAAAVQARLKLASRRGDMDPELTRKGALAHPGGWMLALAALGFFAYVFNLGGLQPMLDGFFGGLNQMAQSKNGDVAALVVSAVPYVEIGLGVVGAWVVLLLLRGALKSGTKAAKLSSRKPLTRQEFIDLAAIQSISTKVAREAYDLLLPHYNNHMRTRLSDSLASDLRLSRNERADLVGNLLRRTDRMSQWEEEDDVDTVLDLLIAVEETRMRSLAQISRQTRRV